MTKDEYVKTLEKNLQKASKKNSKPVDFKGVKNGGINVFYLRVKGTKNQFMRRDNPYEVTSDLSEAAAYERQVHAVSRKQAYKASLGTIDRLTKKFEIITEEVARYGLASADRKLHV